MYHGGQVQLFAEAIVCPMIKNVVYYFDIPIAGAFIRLLFAIRFLLPLV